MGLEALAGFYASRSSRKSCLIYEQKKEIYDKDNQIKDLNTKVYELSAKVGGGQNA